MIQHLSLSQERWSQFSFGQQVLMIGNEMNRGRKLSAPEDRDRRRRCYERVLRLTDLTVRSHRRPALWRELLRWRDLVAALYIADEPDPRQHDATFRALLMLTPQSYGQVALLFG